MSKKDWKKNKNRPSMQEIERLFYSGKLSERTRNMIGTTVQILGRYMFIDRNILNYRAEKIIGEKIGLSFIKRAIELEIIVELQDAMFPLKDPDKISGNHFYYTLAVGGLNLLRLSKTTFRQFNILDKYEEKLRVLQFNYMAMDDKLNWIFSEYSDLKEYLYFHCKDSKDRNVILYFSDEINKDELLTRLCKIYITRNKLEKDDIYIAMEYLLSNYKFKSVKKIDTTFTDEIIYDENRKKRI